MLNGGPKKFYAQKFGLKSISLPKKMQLLIIQNLYYPLKMVFKNTKVYFRAILQKRIKN